MGMRSRQGGDWRGYWKLECQLKVSVIPMGIGHEREVLAATLRNFGRSIEIKGPSILEVEL